MNKAAQRLYGKSEPLYSKTRVKKMQTKLDSEKMSKEIEFGKSTFEEFFIEEKK